MQTHTKASLRPFLGRVINNAIKYKRYTKLMNGILIYLDKSNGINEDFFDSLLAQVPFYVYRTRGWRITVFTGLNNGGLYICVSNEKSYN